MCTGRGELTTRVILPEEGIWCYSRVGGSLPARRRVPKIYIPEVGIYTGERGWRQASDHRVILAVTCLNITMYALLDIVRGRSEVRDGEKPTVATTPQ